MHMRQSCSSLSNDHANFGLQGAPLRVCLLVMPLVADDAGPARHDATKLPVASGSNWPL